MVNSVRAIHPGEILKDELEELNLSANAFAKLLGVPTNRITAILNEQRGITAETALRMAAILWQHTGFLDEPAKQLRYRV